MENKVVPLHKPIPPKEERFTHKGQTFLCRYDPNAPPDNRWVWVLNYVRTYKYIGSSASLQGAKAKARRQIDKMTNRQIAVEEDDG